jgi:hypothetical protein
VLEDRIALNQLEQIGIRLGETSNEVSNLGKVRIETSRQIGSFDAAIIRFEQPELIAALQRGWHFLTPNDLGDSNGHVQMPRCRIPSRDESENGLRLFRKIHLLCQSSPWPDSGGGERRARRFGYFPRPSGAWRGFGWGDQQSAPSCRSQRRLDLGSLARFGESRISIESNWCRN